MGSTSNGSRKLGRRYSILCVRCTGAHLPSRFEDASPQMNGFIDNVRVRHDFLTQLILNALIDTNTYSVRLWYQSGSVLRKIISTS